MNHPVGLWGGHKRAVTPYPSRPCDSPVPGKLSQKLLVAELWNLELTGGLFLWLFAAGFQVFKKYFFLMHQFVLWYKLLYFSREFGLFQNYHHHMSSSGKHGKLGWISKSLWGEVLQNWAGSISSSLTSKFLSLLLLLVSVNTARITFPIVSHHFRSLATLKVTTLFWTFRL